ncbi:MAG: YecA family protein [Acidimicrobiales bacterium]
MAQCGRNGLCECGSGAKAKRCCGLRRGPAPTELAKAFLAEQRRIAAVRLLGVKRDDFDELFDEVTDLPTRDVSMQLRLPRVLSPELEALRAAIEDDDEEGVDALVGPALAQLDDPLHRAALARSVLALAEAGRVGQRVAAVAVIDLTTESSALLRCSVLEALAVSVGAARTPAGLVVVSR